MRRKEWWWKRIFDNHPQANIKLWVCNIQEKILEMNSKVVLLRLHIKSYHVFAMWNTALYTRAHDSSESSASDPVSPKNLCSYSCHKHSWCLFGTLRQRPFISLAFIHMIPGVYGTFLLFFGPKLCWQLPIFASSGYSLSHWSLLGR